MCISENDLRKKWKYLREKFSSDYSKRLVGKSGDTTNSYPSSKWPYFQQLMFLKDIVQTRASSGPIAPSIETKLEPLADTGPVDDVDIDATLSTHKIRLTSQRKRWQFQAEFRTV